MPFVIMALIISSGASEECGILQLTVTHFRHRCTGMLSQHTHTVHTRSHTHSLALPSKQSWAQLGG